MSVCDFCKALGIREYRLDKLVEEVECDICFREKKMGKTKGEVAKRKREGENMQRD